jgi:FSR family fosmidomycin resistance protein-like MFS transporter
MTAATATAAPGRDLSVIGLVCGGHLFSHFYMLTLPPLFPVLKTELGVSYTALGGLLTAFSLASGSAQYPMGILVDRFGARYILIGGLSLLASAFALMSLAPGYDVLLALAFVAGFGNSVFHPADYSIIGASVNPARLGRAYSIHTFSGHIGWSAAPPVMVFLTALWSWRAALAVVGILGLMMALTLFLGRRRFASDLAHAHAPAAAPRAQTPTGKVGTGKAGALSVLTAPPVLLMFFFFMMTSAILIALPSFTPASLTTLFGTPLVDANAALTAFLVGGAIGVLTGGLVADRLRRLDLIAALGFCAAAVAVVLVGNVAMSVVPLAAVFAFAGFMLGIISPSRDLLVRAITPPGASGKVFGFVSVGLDVGGVLAPLIFGFIIDRGWPAGVFLIAAALMMLALLAALGASQFARARLAPHPAE